MAGEMDYGAKYDAEAVEKAVKALNLSTPVTDALLMISREVDAAYRENMDALIQRVRELENEVQRTHDEVRRDYDKTVADCWRAANAKLEARIRSLEAALNKIACWHEGREVDGGFDEPWSARVAREALAGKESP